MDAFSAGQLSRALDRLHSTIYFVPQADEMFTELGLVNQRTQYFASRSAPMGAVTAKVVAATFYNPPRADCQSDSRRVGHRVTDRRDEGRYQIVDAVMPRILGEERVRSPEFAHPVAIVRRTAEAVRNADGRPLYAGHAEFDWPETPHGQLWACDHLVARIPGRRPHRCPGRARPRPASRH